jgi:hypothetical protein
MAADSCRECSRVLGVDHSGVAAVSEPPSCGSAFAPRFS